MLILGTALELPFKNESFENVHCSDLIEHFEPDRVIKLLKELYRILKEGGKLLIATPVAGKAFWGDPTHIRSYPPESLVGLFRGDDEKGTGTNHTSCHIGVARIIGIYPRYSPIIRVPTRLYTKERRRCLANLIHPHSLLFFASKLLARVGVLKFWAPSGYSLVLGKVAGDYVTE
jgi:SAM-dependent methyltransferase